MRYLRYLLQKLAYKTKISAVCDVFLSIQLIPLLIALSCALLITKEQPIEIIGHQLVWLLTHSHRNVIDLQLKNETSASDNIKVGFLLICSHLIVPFQVVIMLLYISVHTSVLLILVPKLAPSVFEIYADVSLPLIVDIISLYVTNILNIHKWALVMVTTSPFKTHIPILCSVIAAFLPLYLLKSNRFSLKDMRTVDQTDYNSSEEQETVGTISTST